MCICDGICKKGLPHAPNSMNLKDSSLCLKAQKNLKFSFSVKLQYAGTQTFQSDGCF